MFEHILLETSSASKGKKLLSVVVSTLTQCLLICAMVVSPLLFTEGVPRVAQFTQRWVETPPPPPPPPGPERPTTHGSQRGGVSVSRRPRIEGERPDFTKISVGIPPETGPIDIGPAPVISTGSPVGVVGGVPDGTGVLFVGNYRTPIRPVETKHEPDKPVLISSIDNARILHRPQPVYPQIARVSHIQGVVRLEAIISREGYIENLKIISGHPLLVQAALDAVKQWRYQPTLLNGHAVEVITTIDVNFMLSQ